MIGEVLETAGKHKCTCGKGPIPNITMTRLEADKNRHNLILTAQRQRLRSKRETSSEQGQDYDDYIVNGSKIWTTGAHNANRIFCLVRTSTEGKRQEGISFLLIDMDTPGIKVDPIIMFSTTSDF